MGSDADSQYLTDSDDEDVFSSIVGREARRILFDLLHITYHLIRRYKAYHFDEIIDFVAAKFEVLCHIYFVYPGTQITLILHTVRRSQNESKKEDIKSNGDGD